MALWGRKTGELGICATGNPGEIGIWMVGADLQVRKIYRIKVSLANPEGLPKEAQLSITWDPPQVAAFLQPVHLPEGFRSLFETDGGPRALITLTAYGTNRTTVSKTYDLEKVRKIYRGEKGKGPKIEQRLPIVEQDPPVIFSLDYGELQVRKIKLAQLEEAAKAKIKPPAPPPPATSVGAAPQTTAAVKSES